MPELEDAEKGKRRHVLVAVLPWIVVCALTPATIVAGAILGRQSYIIVSVLVVAYAMVPFFVQFESRKPQARELVALAVMIALTVTARVAFAFVPSFKPMAAMVMITGMAFGASAGFLCGSLSLLVSNFIFGQGPWTMFQMLSYGICGFAFGFLSERGIIKSGSWSMLQRVVVSAGGFLFYMLIAGPILDTSSLFWMLSSITPESAMALYIAGVPMNFSQAVATFFVLLLIGNPILSKLERIKVKYGMMS